MPTIEHNSKLGFYQLGQQRYFNKMLALTDASRTGGFPEWHFNRETFDAIDWSVEPETDLRELYRRRAQQLRDQYDYIRLEASGGGDSTTAAYSFINNGIHLDEVIFRYPKMAEHGVTDDPFNTKPENTLSEWRYAAKPLLDWISVHAPQTRITVHDYAEDMLLGQHDESWILKSRDYFQPGHAFKHSVYSLDEHKRTLDTGLRICQLYGIDKPKICIQDGQWYLYFMDIQANMANPDLGSWDNVSHEYFYWTPDLPALIAKQAHMVMNWFNLPSNRHLQHLVRWPNYSFAQRTAFEHIIKPLIYPDYDHTTFQTSKPTNAFYNEMDHWFYVNCQDTHAYRVWQAGLDHIIRNVDAKFFNREMGRPVGFMAFLSPMYYLGPAAFQDPGHNIWHQWQQQ